MLDEGEDGDVPDGPAEEADEAVEDPLVRGLLGLRLGLGLGGGGHGGGAAAAVVAVSAAGGRALRGKNAAAAKAATAQRNTRSPTGMVRQPLRVHNTVEAKF